MRARAGAVLLAALAPAALLAVDPAGWYPFGAPTWLVVATLVPAGTALVLWRGPVRLAPVPTVAAGALVVAVVVAASTGAERLYAWTGTPERHLGVWTWVLLAVVLVGGQALHPGRDGPVVAAGLVAAGLGLGGVAAAEALGWEPDLLDVTAGRLTATLGSAAYLGAAAALLLPAVVGIAADRALPPPLRAAAAAGSPGLVVALIGSGARAAWVGLVAAVAVAGWIRRADLAARPRPTAAVAGTGAVALVVLVALTPVGDRLGALADAGEPGGRGRLDEWRVAARVVADHPLTGVGPEGYRIELGAAVDERYERAHGRDPQPDRAHSAPLDVALAGGLPALAAWSVVVGATLLAAARAVAGRRPWLAGVAVGVVAHHVGSLLLFPTMELDPIAWLLGGLLLAATAVPTGPAGAASRRPDPSDPVEGGVVARRGATGGGDEAPPAAGGDDRAGVEGSAPAAAEAGRTGSGATRADARDRGGADPVHGEVAAAAGPVEPPPGPAGRELRARPVGWASSRPVAVGLAVLALAGAVSGATEVVAERRAGAAVDALGRGDARRAAQAVEGATGLRPDLVRHRVLAARVRVADAQGTLAGLAELDDALRTSPGDPIVRRARAALLVDRARATLVPDHARLARAEIARYLADDPVSAALWLQAGAAARLDDDPAAAQRAWERAEDLAPRSAAAPLELALLHLDTGRPDAAAAALDRARRAAPDDPRLDPVAELVDAALAGGTVGGDRDGSSG